MLISASVRLLGLAGGASPRQSPKQNPVKGADDAVPSWPLGSAAYGDHLLQKTNLPTEDKHARISRIEKDVLLRAADGDLKDNILRANIALALLTTK